MRAAIRYRVAQFFRALTARVDEQDLNAALHILPPPARTLFRRQARQDQRHALDVYHALQRAGHTQKDLLAAALLHDVGKADTRHPAWLRAIIVLLKRFAPRLWDQLSQGAPRGWRRTFIMHAQHAARGAQSAQAAGCSARTVDLIARHEEHHPVKETPTDQLLEILKTFDNRY